LHLTQFLCVNLAIAILVITLEPISQICGPRIFRTAQSGGQFANVDVLLLPIIHLLLAGIIGRLSLADFARHGLSLVALCLIDFMDEEQAGGLRVSLCQLLSTHAHRQYIEIGHPENRGAKVRPNPLSLCSANNASQV